MLSMGEPADLPPRPVPVAGASVQQTSGAAPARSRVRLVEDDPRERRREFLAAVRPFAAFAVGALLIFIGVGWTLFTVVQDDVRQFEERSAETHAVFIASSILRYQLQPGDLAGGVTPA